MRHPLRVQASNELGQLQQLARGISTDVALPLDKRYRESSEWIHKYLLISLIRNLESVKWSLSARGLTWHDMLYRYNIDYTMAWHGLRCVLIAPLCRYHFWYYECKVSERKCWKNCSRNSWFWYKLFHAALQDTRIALPEIVYIRSLGWSGRFRVRVCVCVSMKAPIVRIHWMNQLDSVSHRAPRRGVYGHTRAINGIQINYTFEGIQLIITQN